MHIKTAGNKKYLSISRSEWEAIGKTAGWNADVHPLDREEEIFHDVMGHEQNYCRRVHAKLWDIVAEVERVSEKAFAANKEIDKRVDAFLRTPAAMKVVEEFEEKGFRPEFCAEKLYAVAGDALRREDQKTAGWERTGPRTVEIEEGTRFFDPRVNQKGTLVKRRYHQTTVWMMLYDSGEIEELHGGDLDVIEEI